MRGRLDRGAHVARDHLADRAELARSPRLPTSSRRSRPRVPGPARARARARCAREPARRQPGVRRPRRARRPAGGRGGAVTLLQELLDVLLGHASAAAGAGDLRDIERVLRDHARDDRRHEAARLAVAVRVGVVVRRRLGRGRCRCGRRRRDLAHGCGLGGRCGLRGRRRRRGRLRWGGGLSRARRHPR